MSEICLNLLLVGDSMVGKTSLLLKFTDGNFPENHMATIGVEYKDKTIKINGRPVKLQIWDTSGQERFRSITQNFYRNADGILFIFDMTSPESFYHIKDWLRDSETSDSEIKRIIVGNKLDLENDRKIDKKKMDHYAEGKNIKSYEVSAKSGKNVEKIFKEIAELIIKNKTEEEIHSLHGNKTGRNVSTSTISYAKYDKKKKCC
jgi:small GTP-binding protein